MKVVVSVGGSVVASPAINREFISGYANMVLELQREGINVASVVGGGKVAREYIGFARELGGPEHLCDEIGILATRMNAYLLISALGKNANRRIPTSVEEADEDGLIVMGGTAPGHTTDAVSAMLARRIGASLLVNASDVDGIYDRDPKKHPGAKRLEKVKVEELLKLLRKKHVPGISSILDSKALHIIMEERIRAIVLDGRDLNSLKGAIRGGDFTGTEVVHNNG